MPFLNRGTELRRAGHRRLDLCDHPAKTLAYRSTQVVDGAASRLKAIRELNVTRRRAPHHERAGVHRGGEETLENSLATRATRSSTFVRRSESMKPTGSDKILRDAVVKGLEDDPEIVATHISVTALDGAIALGGHVATYHQKQVAVRVAERVPAER